MVFLMGLSNLEHIAKGLIKGGKSPDTPAAVIEDGSLASQRTVRGTLETIYEKSLKAGLKTPAIIVVGETAAFDLRSEEMTGDKIDDKPLSGLTVGITGTPSFTARLENCFKIPGRQNTSCNENGSGAGGIFRRVFRRSRLFKSELFTYSYFKTKLHLAGLYQCKRSGNFL